MTETGTTTPMFTRKEQEHLEVLQARLDHVRDDRPERSGDPAYPPGEANALAWALSVIQGSLDTAEVRIERVERTMRKMGAQLGRLQHTVEQALAEEDE